jgi:hypothetical protein
MGTFSQKDRKAYQNICHLSEQGVLAFMRDLLLSRYEKVVVTPAYVYAIGDLPVALVAHADTVFKVPPALENFFYDQEKDVVWNPDGAGADDRAGIFAIMKIVRTHKLKPHIIVTTGEESGCIGAGKLIVAEREFPGELKFMIQLDRRNQKDAVYYDCDNPKFEDFITQFGFTTEWGTLSDISLLAPAYKVAAVNLSVGYEDEHHEVERLHVNWLYETIGKVVEILHYVKDHPELEKFEYIPTVYGSYFFNRLHGYGGAWYDDDDDYWDAPGYEHCFMCNQLVRTDSMIPVWYPYGKHSYNMCLQCHSDLVHQIVWCEKCGKAYYLSAEQAKKIEDVNKWTCEECANGHGNEGPKVLLGSGSNSKTVQQGAPVQPGSGSAGNEHGSDFGGMGEEQRVVRVNEQLDHIRTPRTCLL